MSIAHNSAAMAVKWMAPVGSAFIFVLRIRICSRSVKCKRNAKLPNNRRAQGHGAKGADIRACILNSIYYKLNGCDFVFAISGVGFRSVLSSKICTYFEGPNLIKNYF